KAGKVDAGVSDVSNMADAGKSGLRTLADGKMWRELPDYPYQLAYASERAIRVNREGIVRILAAYARMFRFLSSPDSFAAYRESRAAAGDAGSEEAARTAWTHIQTEQPYANSPLTSAARLDYLQKLHVSVGLQKSVLQIDAVADLSLARDALKL